MDPRLDVTPPVFIARGLCCGIEQPTRLVDAAELDEKRGQPQAERSRCSFGKRDGLQHLHSLLRAAERLQALGLAHERTGPVRVPRNECLELRQGILPAPERHKGQRPEPDDPCIITASDLRKRLQCVRRPVRGQLRLRQKGQSRGPVFRANGQASQRLTQLAERNFGDLFRERLPRLADKRGLDRFRFCKGKQQSEHTAACGTEPENGRRWRCLHGASIRRR